MKKLIALVVVLVLLAFPIAHAGESFDFSEMSLEELIALRDKIENAIANVEIAGSDVSEEDITPDIDNIMENLTIEEHVWIYEYELSVSESSREDYPYNSLEYVATIAEEKAIIAVTNTGEVPLRGTWGVGCYIMFLFDYNALKY